MGAAKTITYPESEGKITHSQIWGEISILQTMSLWGEGEVYVACPPGENGVRGGRAHVVVVVRAGSGTQNLIVALQEGMKAALKSLELLEHLDVLRRGRMAVGNPKRQ